MSVEHRDVKRVLRLHERLDRLWRDDRFDNARRGGELRQLAEALIWCSWFEIPAEDDGWAKWVTARLGARSWDSVGYLIGDDAPRFEPPDLRYTTTCQVPLERGRRAGQPCDKRPYMSGRVTDPKTGQWRVTGWCSQHKAHAEAARIAENTYRSSGAVPEPLPNTGGLLPCHAPVKNWPDLYVSARPSWKPPKVGIRADDWPVMEKVTAAEAPKLVLLSGGRPADAPDPCGPDGQFSAGLVAAGRIRLGGITTDYPPLRAIRDEDDDDD